MYKAKDEMAVQCKRTLMDKVASSMGSRLGQSATVTTKYLCFMHFQTGQTTHLRTSYVDNV